MTWTPPVAEPPRPAEPPPQPVPQNATPVRLRGGAIVLVAGLAGAAASVVLGVYGRVHHPTGVAVNIAGFSSPVAVKAWLATVAFLFAIVQLVSALAMYGRLPGIHVPSWTGTVHRWSGRIAVAVSVPVAAQCLYALGFQDFGTRGLLHSLLGCLFYGAFVAKMLVLSRPDAPSWALPLFGGLLFAVFTGIWLTAALWYFQTYGITT